MKKNINKDIQKILSSKTLHIKALTSAGIITGIVTDILVDPVFSKSSNILDDIFDKLSSSTTLTLESNNLIYVIETSKLFPISNLNTSIYLDRVELNSSKIIALCSPFEEVD